MRAYSTAWFFDKYIHSKYVEGYTADLIFLVRIASYSSIYYVQYIEVSTYYYLVCWERKLYVLLVTVFQRFNLRKSLSALSFLLLSRTFDIQALCQIYGEVIHV